MCNFCGPDEIPGRGREERRNRYRRNTLAPSDRCFAGCRNSTRCVHYVLETRQNPSRARGSRDMRTNPARWARFERHHPARTVGTFEQLAELSTVRRPDRLCGRRNCDPWGIGQTAGIVIDLRVPGFRMEGFPLQDVRESHFSTERFRSMDASSRITLGRINRFRQDV
jgi:hypothetical protein